MNDNAFSAVSSRDGAAKNRHKLRLTRFRLVLIDSVLMGLAFFWINYLKRGAFGLPGGYDRLLLLFYVCWLISCLVAKKFVPDQYKSYWQGAGGLLKSVLYLTYMVVFVVVMFDWSGYSRVQVFATCGMLFFLEMVVWTTGYRYLTPAPSENGDSEDAGAVKAAVGQRSHFSYRFLGLDFILLIGAFFTVNWLKRGHLDLLPGYDQLLLILVGMWFAISLIGNKFNVVGRKNFYFAVWQWIKSGLLMLAILALLVFGLRMFQYSRIQGFGTLLMLLGLELPILALYFANRKQKKAQADIESSRQVSNILSQEEYDLNIDLRAVRQRLMAPCTRNLQRYFQPDNRPFFDFLYAHVDLDKILNVETLVDRSCEPFTVRGDQQMLRLYVGLRRVNDCRRLNVHFIQLHQMLLPGGYFAGHAHTIKTHRDWIYTKYPRQMAHVVYGLHFIVHRLAPKLPWIKNVYFAVTKGKNRMISKAEVLGRLCFCGFDIVATNEIGNRLYFIVRKVKTASLDQNPTYGPLVALKRSGYGGRMVHTYKFRTMHPYSEYLQQYMVDQYGLKKGGKIKNDFRLTTWGKVMRKLWIDELPMFYNWFKGDFSLVGVRPLSHQYLSLYDPALRALRKKVRPGLIPPYYADMPETLEEILNSEQRYIQAYLKRPLYTQVQCFFKAMVNIAVKGARSG